MNNTVKSQMCIARASNHPNAMGKGVSQFSFLYAACLILLLCSPVLAQQPTGMVTCTNEVPASTCKAVTTELALDQDLSRYTRNVQFLIVDRQTFDRQKSASVDITLSKFVTGNFTPFVHSSFDDDLIFQVTKNSAVGCPDRIVISIDLFRPVKKTGIESAESADPKLIGQYGMFIVGYIEGCWGKKAPAEASGSQAAHP